MFRIIIAVIFLILAASLWFGHPEVWHWPKLIHVDPAITLLIVTRPLSIIILVFLSIALVMTRKVL